MPPELSLLTTSDSELPMDDAAAFSLPSRPLLLRTGMATLRRISRLPPALADPPVADEDNVIGVDEVGVDAIVPGLESYG